MYYPQGTVDFVSTLVAISGSSGFLGSALVRAFEDQGLTTIGLDLHDPPASCQPTHFYKGDLRDEKWCQKLTAGCSIVVHAAASVPLAKSKDLFSVNVEGSSTLASASADAEVFVHISSSAVYGRPAVVPVSVSGPLRPVEPYGRSKLLAEQAVSSMLPSSTRLVVLRPRTILSPDRGGIFSVLFDSISRNSAVPVFGSQTTIQLLHLTDCVDAVLAATSPSFPAATLNLGAHSPLPLATHLRDLVDATGSTSKICVLPPRLASTLASAASSAGLLPYAPWHTKTYGVSHVLDLTDTTALNLTPKFSNYETLYDAFTNRRLLTGNSPHTSALSSPLSRSALWMLGKLCRSS
jgi:nucleoside-diphosphate-sugar epimerase